MARPKGSGFWEERHKQVKNSGKPNNTPVANAVSKYFFFAEKHPLWMKGVSDGKTN